MPIFNPEPTTDDDGWRWYGDYISATTILGNAVANKGLESYFKNSSPKKIEAKRQETAKFGSDAHELFYNILMTQNYEVPETHKEHVAGFMRWIVEHNVEPKNCETSVYSEDDGYGGKLDFHGLVDGKEEIDDWKTGTKYSVTNGWQIAAYRRAAIKMGLASPECGMRGLKIDRVTAEVKDFLYVHIDFCEHKFLAALEVFKGLYYSKLDKLKWPWLHKKAVICAA